jgi:hypothetical protein
MPRVDKLGHRQNRAGDCAMMSESEADVYGARLRTFTDPMQRHGSNGSMAVKQLQQASSGVRLSPTTRTTYAAPKFSESPSAQDLPPPPIRWILDSLITNSTADQSPTSIAIAVPSA